MTLQNSDDLFSDLYEKCNQTGYAIQVSCLNKTTHRKKKSPQAWLTSVQVFFLIPQEYMLHIIIEKYC